MGRNVRPGEIEHETEYNKSVLAPSSKARSPERSALVPSSDARSSVRSVRSLLRADGT